MVSENLAETVLFTPLGMDVNELYILSGNATPNMLSWYITNIQHRTESPIKIHLLVGMVPFDRLSMSVHEGFIQLVSSELPQDVELVECSYICEAPAVHSNIYIWAKDGTPAQAFMGSANFVQSSFVGHHRQELMTACDPTEAMQYYQTQVGRSIYCTHGEIEEYINIPVIRIIPVMPECIITTRFSRRAGYYYQRATGCTRWRVNLLHIVNTFLKSKAHSWRVCLVIKIIKPIDLWSLFLLLTGHPIDCSDL